ncbi:MAG: 6-phosphofructokinase [Patescibacteria group bacterium]
MERIAVLTSGGDAPGMNAAIRAVVRQGLHHGLKVFGIRRGFAGLMAGEMEELATRQVGDILQRGGTILRSARSPEFKTDVGLASAMAQLERRGIEGLVVIGGNGSFRGGLDLAERGIRVVGIPASIDNDIGGTDFSIGFDTAVNTVLDAVNKIRDTASSHARVYVIEVMGRNAGFIAVAAGLAGGAEAVLIPELPYDLGQIARQVKAGYERGKSHSIILVAEGIFGDPVAGLAGSYASAFRIGQALMDMTGFETRITVLGHLQRGGTPTAMDRLIATRSGEIAVRLLMAGESRVMVGFSGNEPRVMDLARALEIKRRIDPADVELINTLAVT